jgi:hypothetical protein
MHNCIGQSLPGSVGLRHPPDGRQQLGRQFCLGDKIIRTGGHRRPPVGVALQQGQSDDTHIGHHLSLVLTLDAYRGSLTLTIPRHPGRPNRLMLAVAASAHAFAAIFSDMAALSSGLRTPPACPERSRRVASNARLGRVLVAEHGVASQLFEYNNYTSDFVSHHAVLGAPHRPRPPPTTTC